MFTSLFRTISMKTVVKRSVWIIAFIGYMLSVALFLRLTTKTPPPPSVVVRPVAINRTAPESPKFGVPVRLTIPSINVGAIVASAGLTSDGAMDIPKNIDDVAWYNLGARPGNVGSAVIAGHYGWENGKGAVFNNLHTLKSGDEVLVSDEKGMTTTFVVRQIQTYDPNADASEIFKSSDGKPHLNLITCEGVWIRDKQTYSNRLVVFTDKKS
jgi:LPXTG-site transpeptidase (sortase) family protein